MSDTRTEKLNPQSPLPLYHQLAGILTARIRGGDYPAGERIPSEHQLASAFGIGRPTVRQAVDVLVRKGLLVRRRGSGTYVGETRQEVDLFSLDGTSVSFHKAGLPVKSRILRPMALRVVQGPGGNPFSGAKAFCLCRLTLVGAAPVLIEDTFLHPRLFAGIDTVNLEEKSLSAVAEEQFYLRPNGGRQTFQIGYPDADLARALKVSREAPVLIVQRFLHFPQERNGVFSVLTCRTDQFVFSQNIGGPDHA
ncbi:MAG: GntR family transcriptional regulator [Desulfobacterales bacterium]